MLNMILTAFAQVQQSNLYRSMRFEQNIRFILLPRTRDVTYIKRGQKPDTAFSWKLHKPNLNY